MAPVQIKVVYDYYSAKRTTPFFITEEELLNLDFHSFKSRLLLEVPHIAKSTSAKALRLTMSDENLEVDLSPIYFSFQIKEIIAKKTNITVQAFPFESPSVSVDSTARSASREFTAQKTNTGGQEPEAKRQKQGSLEYASKARRSHDLKQETELNQSLEGLDEVFEWRPPNKAQDHNKHQTPLQRYVSKTEEEILSKQQYIDRLKEKESEIVINLQVLVAHGQSKRLC